MLDRSHVHGIRVRGDYLFRIGYRRHGIVSIITLIGTGFSILIPYFCSTIRDLDDHGDELRSIFTVTGWTPGREARGLMNHSSPD